MTTYCMHMSKVKTAQEEFSRRNGVNSRVVRVDTIVGLKSTWEKYTLKSSSHMFEASGIELCDDIRRDE